MANYWLCAVLFRIVLPLSISTALYIRPSITSYVYLILGCYSPFFSVPTPKTMAGPTRAYMKILVISSMCTTSLVASFYLVLFFRHDHEYNWDPCTPLEKAIRTLGVVNLQDLSIINTVPWCLPEPLMLGTSILLYFLFKKFCQDTEVILAAKEMEGREIIKEVNRKKVLSMMVNCGKYLVIFMLCLTAVLKATAIGAIYFIMFLSVMTYWACNQSLGKAFARVMVCLLPIMFIHLSTVFLYQLQYLQDSETFDEKSIWGRLLNLVDINAYKDCKDPRLFKFHAESKSILVLPIILFFMYYLTVLVTREILQANDGVNSLLLACFRCRRVSHWQKTFFLLQKRAEEEKLRNVQLGLVDKIKYGIEQILQFIISISYLAANFIMMIWAISYVSWKTWFLLVWANLIWLLPFRKKVMLVTTPFVVVWVWVMLSISYLYSMDLTEDELPSVVNSIQIDAGVDRTSDMKWLHLLTKSLYGVIIFVSMRQLWHERSVKKQQIQLAEAMGLGKNEAVSDLDISEKKSKFIERFQEVCLYLLSIWWIWVVIITMILMDFWTTSYLFSIVFVALAFLCITTFQLCPFGLWKKFLRIYWWIVIIYAIINLFIIYLYQLVFMRRIFHKYISEKRYRSFGFRVWTDSKELFMNLLKPIFFQIAVLMQQNFFQTEFEKLTTPSPLQQTNIQKNASPRWKRVRSFFDNITNVFFKLLEVHLHNLILLVGWYMCLCDMCALFVPLVILFTMSCVIGRTFTNIVIYLTSVLVQILIFLRLVYMNQYTEHKRWNYVGHYTRNGKPFNKTLNTADWLGFYESDYGTNYADFWKLSWCFLYIFTVTIMRVVTIRMQHYRLRHGLTNIHRRLLFPEITFENCNESTLSLLKFLMNYGFFKFGFEITVVFASIVMGLRMDAVAIVISFWLLLVFSLNRETLRIIWLPSLVICAMGVPLQYLSTLGYWPTEWENSRTRFWSSTDVLLRVQQFCHLMNMAHPPIKWKISLDFWLLLLLTRQWRGFRREQSLKDKYSMAGRNDDVSQLIDDDDVVNPVPDFMTYTRTYLDPFKRILLIGWFYMSLCAVFFAATQRPTLYSFGYIMGAFIFVWEGSDFFLRHPKKILSKWNLLLAYNIIVMVIRTSSQTFGCILKYYQSIQISCTFYKIFTIGCVDKYTMTAGVPNVSKESTCPVDYVSLGLGYDCLCLFFLIFQQRIFKSYHFFHIANDAKAQTYLADQGDMLIELDRQKKRQEIDAKDTLIKSNIEKKMNLLRDTHLKVQKDVYLRRKKNHNKMLKTSDYYLFDDQVLANDIPLLPTKKGEEDDAEHDPFDPMTISEYFGLWNSTSIVTVLAERTRLRKMKSALQQGKKVDDIRKAQAMTDPKPGTSKDPDAVSPIALSRTRSFFNIMMFLWGAFESLIVSITGLINYSTKTFRKILYEMNKKQTILKEKTKYTQGMRSGSNKTWNPVHSYKDILNSEANKQEDGVTTLQYSIYAKLLRAVWYLLLSKSEWLCYLMIIFNQLLRANFISLPLVIMAFCWGALTIPRPTKTYWVTAIAYVLIMSLIKAFFLMNIVPWNEDPLKYRDNIFFPPNIIGVYSETNILLTNLLLLVCLFFHRVVLQMLGQWKPTSYRLEDLIQDGEYVLKDGKLIPSPKGNKNKNDILVVKSVEVAMGDYFPKSVVHGVQKYAESLKIYVQQLILPSSNQIPVDVYTPMFLCDLMNFFIVMFFFGYFQTRNEKDGFIEFIQNNRVPSSFIVIILLYFILIVVDRAIYLRRNRFAKLVYFFFQVISYHLWFFVLYPLIRSKKANHSIPVQMFYLLKCFYFLLSAYQIRNGYPQLISCHYLWHGTTIFHRFGYKLYRVIPYFFEMRTLLDWICSDSCLGVNDWLKMEEITQNIFDQKCEQDIENRWGSSAGRAKNRIGKYIFGGFLYILLILTVIFPFLIFSLGGSVGIATHPTMFHMLLYMGKGEPIYESYATEGSLKQLTVDDYKNLTDTFNNIQSSENIFDNFEPEDVLAVTWSGHSLTKWRLSPPIFNETMEQLKSDKLFFFRMEIKYMHEGAGANKQLRTFGQSTSIPPLPDKQRQILINMLSGNSSNEFLWLQFVLPKFLLITKESYPQVLPIMESSADEPVVIQTQNAMAIDNDDDADLMADTRTLRNLLLSLKHSDNGDMWWHVQEESSVNDDNYFYYLKGLIYNNCDSLVIYTFNEKVFSPVMNYLTQSGILGLYLLYFMMVIGIIRRCRIEIGEIWIEDLPDSDNMMRKCLEVYVARDMQNYELEEELFAELIFIMRSREILIKMTRCKDSPYNPPLLINTTKKK